eukprot:306939-Prymnesium_polylepis.1
MTSPAVNLNPDQLPWPVAAQRAGAYGITSKKAVTGEWCVCGQRLRLASTSRLRLSGLSAQACSVADFLARRAT